MKMTEKKSFLEQMTVPQNNENSEENETFSDIANTVANILQDGRYKQNYIAILNRNQAIGIIQAMGKRKFLETVIGPIPEPELKADPETGQMKIHNISYRKFDTSVTNSAVVQALVNYPAVTGKRSEQIVDIFRSLLPTTSEVHKSDSILSKLTGPRVRR